MQKCPLVFGQRISSDSRETTPIESRILDSDFFWHSQFGNCCFASAESVAAGVFGCRPRSFSRSAVFLKFWKIIAPGKGVEWLGGQGDEWDAQNDMLSALLGSLTMMTAVALTNRKKTSR